MSPGGIHNQLLLQSRQITHRIADLAAAYTEVVGKTFIDLYPKPDQKTLQVVYICASFLHLAVESLDFLQAEKKQLFFYEFMK